MKNIVVIGSGGFAKEVCFLIEEINRNKKEWNILGFIDTNVGDAVGRQIVYQDDEWISKTTKHIHIAFGLGNPLLVKKLHTYYSRNHNLIYPNLVHPSVIGDWEHIKFGQGNIIMAGNLLTTDIEIGSFNVINLDCTIGHDARIKSYNVLNPSVNISGGVKIESEVLIGTGAQILQNLEICNNAIVGAGSVLTKNITKKGVYIGSPAIRKEK